MEPDTSYDFETADGFWDELENIVSRECDTHSLIDESLRSYLTLVTTYRGQYVQTDDDLGYCAYKLYASSLFSHHAAYIRRQFIYCLLQDDDPDVLRIAMTFLLADAREDEKLFELLNAEGVFPRLVELIANPREQEEAVHRQMMELLYEMARIQKISNEDLSCVDDDFVRGLFNIIEEVSDDVNDPYHYPVIRVLLVLNEQFMVAAHDPAVATHNPALLTNKVMKVLSAHGSNYKTFGSNIILLLNREDETSLQLLTLKLMYLLFTTPLTYEYFYTNDVRVLADILVRNLLDLPDYSAALRHTYLRVLYPLLQNTQLQHPPFYKRDEIRKLLALLCGDQAHADGNETAAHMLWNHFEDVDDTTKRLVRRCQTVTWLTDDETDILSKVDSPTEDRLSASDSPSSPTKTKPPAIPAPRKLRKRNPSQSSTLSASQYLAPQMQSARQSSLSMHEMAAQREKPGIITPSRNPSLKHGLRQAIIMKKEKPPPPKARRSGLMRPKPHHIDTEIQVTRTDLPEELMTEELEQIESELEDWERSDLDDDDLPDIQIEGPSEETKPVKKPPPAPKARRWGRRRKSNEEVVERSKEPGKFSSILPSRSANAGGEPPYSPREEHHQSPFVPLPDKTLSPTNGSPVEGRQREKRSISAAMEEAQAQAVHHVEQCLEHTHINDHEGDPHAQELKEKRSESPTLQQQHQPAVLAPPGQAPIRGVPGPRIELERSPFMSDEENEIREESEEDGNGK